MRRTALVIAAVLLAVGGGTLFWHSYTELPDIFAKRAVSSPLPTRPPGWRPPAWPTPRAATHDFTPDFAITSWSFPNSHEALAFYFTAPAFQSVQNRSGSVEQIRALGRASTVALTSSCSDQVVASVVWRAWTSKGSLNVPVVLHRITVAGRPIWAFVCAWEEIYPGVPGSCGHIRVQLLRPDDGSVLDEASCT